MARPNREELLKACQFSSLTCRAMIQNPLNSNTVDLEILNLSQTVPDQVAIIHYLIDSSFESIDTFVDINFPRYIEVIEHIEHMPSSVKLETAIALLRQVQLSTQ